VGKNSFDVLKGRPHANQLSAKKKIKKK